MWMEVKMRRYPLDYIVGRIGVHSLECPLGVDAVDKVSDA
jgi:hypothetical protein